MTIEELKKSLNIVDTLPRDKTEEDISNDIGTMITELRILKGITQEELAEKVGTKQPSIARLENGSGLPSLKFLYKIAKALDTYIVPPKFGLIEEYKKNIKISSGSEKISIQNAKAESTKIKVESGIRI